MRRIRVLFAASLLTAGCTSEDIKKHVDNLPDWAIPGVAGVLGGETCYSFFEGKARVVATAICAGGGAWIGKKLRDYLKEEEQAQLAEATYNTLDTGEKQTVKTEEGTTITTELAKPQPSASRPAPAAPSPRPTTPTAPSTPTPSPTTTAATEDCGTVTQTIVTADNQRFQDTVSACKKDGVWVAG